MNSPITPNQALSPEEDARLQIIEATEVKSIDETPKRVTIVKPILAERPVVTPVHSTVSKLSDKPLVVTSTKKPVPAMAVVPELPKVPSTPASQMADELSHAPKFNFAKFALLFFPKRKFSKKPMLFVIFVLLVAGGVVIGFISWQALRSISR